MNKTLAEARDFVDALVALGVPAGVHAFVLPPHTALATVRARLPRDCRHPPRGAERALGGRGRRHRRGLDADGPRRRRHHGRDRPLRAAGRTSARPTTTVRRKVGGRPRARPRRRWSASVSRAEVRERARPSPSSPRQVRAALSLVAPPTRARGAGRLRAGLGDRGVRPHRHPGPGPARSSRPSAASPRRWSRSARRHASSTAAASTSSTRGPLLDGTDVDGLFVGRAGLVRPRLRPHPRALCPPPPAGPRPPHHAPK